MPRSTSLLPYLPPGGAAQVTDLENIPSSCDGKVLIQGLRRRCAGGFGDSERVVLRLSFGLTPVTDVFGIRMDSGHDFLAGLGEFHGVSPLRANEEFLLELALQSPDLNRKNRF